MKSCNIVINVQFVAGNKFSSGMTQWWNSLKMINNKRIIFIAYILGRK